MTEISYAHKCQIESTEMIHFGFEFFPFVFYWAELHERAFWRMNNQQLKQFDTMKALQLDKKTGHISLCKAKVLGRFYLPSYT